MKLLKRYKVALGLSLTSFLLLVTFQNCGGVNFNKITNSSQQKPLTLPADPQPTATPVIVGSGDRGFCRLRVNQLAAFGSPGAPMNSCAPAAYVGYTSVSSFDMKAAWQIEPGPINHTQMCGNLNPSDLDSMGTTLVPVTENSSARLCVTRNECEELLENYLSTPGNNPCNWNPFDASYSRGLILSIHDTAQVPDRTGGATVQFEPNGCTDVESRTYDIVQAEISRLARTRAHFGCETPPNLIP